MGPKNKMHLRSKIMQGNSQQTSPLMTPPLTKASPGASIKLPSPNTKDNRNVANSYPRSKKFTPQINSLFQSQVSTGCKKSPPMLEHSGGSFQDLGFNGTLGVQDKILFQQNSD